MWTSRSHYWRNLPWGRSVSRKRDRPEPVDLLQEEDSSEGEQPERGRQLLFRTRRTEATTCVTVRT